MGPTDGLIRATYVAGWRVHHNEFELAQDRGVRFATSLPIAARTRIYNNLFHGAMAADYAAISVDSNADIYHNTMVIAAGSGVSYCVSLRGFLGRHADLRNNILVHLGTRGRMLKVSSLRGYDWSADSNIYYAPISTDAFAYSGSTSVPSFASWRTVTGQDATSQETDPRVAGGSGAAALKLQADSPAIGAARGTPSWLTTDFAGVPRVSPTAIGAYERIKPATFTTFGTGCAGSLNRIPQIGQTGTVGIGSKDFTVTVRNTLGGARLFFAIGLSNTRIGTASLPLALGGGLQPAHVFGRGVPAAGRRLRPGQRQRQPEAAHPRRSDPARGEGLLPVGRRRPGCGRHRCRLLGRRDARALRGQTQACPRTGVV